MKYDLEDGPLSSGLDSRATEAACFDGFLFGFLRKRLSIDCGDFSFLLWCPLLEKAQQSAVAQTPCLRFQIWQPQVEKSDANAICIMYSRFPNQACARISCLFLPTRDFHLDKKRWGIISFSTNCWFQRNHQKLTWRMMFHILQSGYWYSVFN